VATSRIVSFLNDNGFEITDKPNAKISDEMYEALIKEFRGSMVEKQQAESIVIGKVAPKTPSPEPEKKPATPDSLFAPKKEDSASTPPEKVPDEVTPGQTPPKQDEPPAPTEDRVSRTVLTGPKVVGKIDLDKPKKKKSESPKPKPEPAAPEAPPPKDKTETQTEPAEPVISPEEKQSEKTEVVRAKADRLPGIKVVGKIDQSKLEPSGRTKKRKRKIKKVAKTGADGKPKLKPERTKKSQKAKPEVKEVSTQEVEKELKKTIAKITAGASKEAQRRRRKKRGEKAEKAAQDGVQDTNVLQVTEFITVSELAGLLDVSPTEIISKCFELGVMVSINQRVDAEIIELIASEFGKEVQFISPEDELDMTMEDDLDDEADLKPRPPIVTIMGHVDHGKTSLLDYIRQSRVAASEAGGITQHIGAYSVNVGDKRITFLDTPGHEAFTAMRARGAKMTDIAVIVIAADDSIMPQTREAISHAQAAAVPIIFAINKVDKEGANPERIKQELAEMNLLVEDWGGEYLSEDISAKTGQGVESLLEKILLQAELMELKANPDRPAKGYIIEAALDKGRGYIAKLMPQKGTLRVGDTLVAGEYFGRVKAIINDLDQRIKEVGPAMPAMIMGLNGAPAAGELFKVVPSDAEARRIASKVAQIKREQSNRAQKRISLDEIGRRLALGNFKELKLIVKADTDGSVEALADSLIKLSVETIQVNVIHKAVGQVTESDVLLASASDAIIIGFQVRPSAAARTMAEREKVQIKTYNVIYAAIEDIKSAMEGMLEPVQEEEVIGYAEVREVYSISRIGKVAGCMIQSGKVTRDAYVRIIRNGIVIYPTKENVRAELGSLKRFKDDVKEVRAGMECGLTIKNYNDIKVGDELEFYVVDEVRATLS